MLFQSTSYMTTSFIHPKLSKVDRINAYIFFRKWKRNLLSFPTIFSFLISNHQCLFTFFSQALDPSTPLEALCFHFKLSNAK